MFGNIKKMASGAMSSFKSAFDRVANEGEMEAVVAAAVLMAAADGEIDPIEQDAAFAAVAGHESLGAFSTDLIRQKFESFAKLVKADRQEAEAILIEKISKVKDPTARVRAIGVAKEIANADGRFLEAEKAMVEKIRQAMQ